MTSIMPHAMSVELGFGDATVMTADEFPDFGVVSPVSLGGEIEKSRRRAFGS